MFRLLAEEPCSQRSAIAGIVQQGTAAVFQTVPLCGAKELLRWENAVRAMGIGAPCSGAAISNTHDLTHTSLIYQLLCFVEEGKPCYRPVDRKHDIVADAAACHSNGVPPIDGHGLFHDDGNTQFHDFAGDIGVGKIRRGQQHQIRLQSEQIYIVFVMRDGIYSDGAQILSGLSFSCQIAPFHQNVVVNSKLLRSDNALETHGCLYRELSMENILIFMDKIKI